MGAQITYSGNNTYTSSSTTNSNDDDLLRGYLDTGGVGHPSTVTITNVPANNLPYTVYLYIAGDTPGGRVGDYEVNGVTLSATQGSGTPYMLATPATAGNYLVFTGVTGNTLTITSGASNFRAPLDGLQIVTVPEPASIGLLSLAGVGLLARRRRQ